MSDRPHFLKLYSIICVCPDFDSCLFVSAYICKHTKGYRGYAAPVCVFLFCFGYLCLLRNLRFTSQIIT